jgi:hypothetical protein
MPGKRTIRVRFTQAGVPRALDFDRADRTIVYDGTTKVIPLRD